MDYARAIIINISSTIKAVDNHPLCVSLREFLTSRAELSDDAWCVEDAVVESAQVFGSREVIQWAIETLIEQKQVVRVGRVLAVASEQNVLSKKQKARMEQIVSLFEGNRSPPSVKEITQELQLSEEVVTS